MTTAAARQKVKDRFNIPSAITALDTLIDGCVSDAVDVFSQYGGDYINDSATWVVTTTTTWITIPEAYYGIVAIYVNVGSIPRKLTAWYREADRLYFTEYPPASGVLTVVYRNPIVISGGNIPISAVGWVSLFYNFCYSEFAAFLAGNSSAYNVYVQQAGARGVDNLLALSSFYEQKAQQQADKMAINNGFIA